MAEIKFDVCKKLFLKNKPENDKKNLKMILKKMFANHSCWAYEYTTPLQSIELG